MDNTIPLATIDHQQIDTEIGDFIYKQVKDNNKDGAIVGLSGGKDSATVGAAGKKASNKYGFIFKAKIMPSHVNDDDDEISAVKICKKLGIDYEIIPIEPIVDGLRITNPELFGLPKVYDVTPLIEMIRQSDPNLVKPVMGVLEKTSPLLINPIADGLRQNNPELIEQIGDILERINTKLSVEADSNATYHLGNRLSEIRALILHAKAATENAVLLGTGNRCEDAVLGYYTLFGDGAIHCSPIAALPKRLVCEMISFYGLDEVVQQVPTAGLEPGQTDFKDLGYSYDMSELFFEGYIRNQMSVDQLIECQQVKEVFERDSEEYAELYGDEKFTTVLEVIADINKRYRGAQKKAKLLQPEVAPLTLIYS